jgi:hypothetical protein
MEVVMNEENTKTLYNAFPHQFRDSKYWKHGIDCGDAWYPIIRDLCAAIEVESRRLHLPIDNWPLIVTIKEMRGGLRFYISTSPKTDDLSGIEHYGVRPYPGIESIRKIVVEFERKADEICDDCTRPPLQVPVTTSYAPDCSDCARYAEYCKAVDEDDRNQNFDTRYHEEFDIDPTHIP